jgi:hypothetical protein
MIDLFVNILTPNTLSTEKEGRRILDRLVRELPDHAPNKFGTEEPLPKIDAASLSNHLAKWDQFKPSVYWEKDRISQGGVHFGRTGPQAIHGVVSFEFDRSKVQVSQVERLVKILSPELAADFGAIELLVPQEIESGRQSGTVTALDKKRGTHTFFITSHDLRRAIPDLYWGTVFGKPYLDMFGREKILSAPAYLVEELAPNIVYMQLSQSLDDLRDRYVEIYRRKELLKKHLGREAFVPFGGCELGRNHLT